MHYAAIGNDGAFTNGAAITNAGPEFRIGHGAVTLDGIDDYVDLGSGFDALDGSNAFSLSVWVKPTQLPFNEHDGIFGIGTTSQRAPWLWGLQGVSNLTMQFETVTGGISDCDLLLGEVVQDQWNHIAVTWDGSTCRSYIDGTFDNSDTTTGNTLVNSDGENYLGYLAGFGYWDGHVDDVRIYAKVLTDAEILALYETKYIADMDEDDTIGTGDFAGLAANWQMTGCGDCSGADFTGDGIVGIDDLALLSLMWLTGF